MSAHEDDGGSHGHVGAPIAFLVLALFCGILVRTLAPRRLPFTVWLLVLGGCFAMVFDYDRDGGSWLLFRDGGGPPTAMERLVRSWDTIDPHLLLYVFLPVLIFESARVSPGSSLFRGPRDTTRAGTTRTSTR